MEDRAIGLPFEERAAAPTPVSPDALCQTYASRVYKFAQMISRDAADAEDLAQDALERAIRGLSTFNPAKGDLEGWLWRIVLNAGRDAGRIASRQRLIIELIVERWSRDEVALDLSDQPEAAEVMDAVRSLSRRHRAVLALRFGADLSYRQVGRSLGVSEAAALMATRRALANLRTRLSQGVHQP